MHRSGGMLSSRRYADIQTGLCSIAAAAAAAAACYLRLKLSHEVCLQSRSSLTHHFEGVLCGKLHFWVRAAQQRGQAWHN